MNAQEYARYLASEAWQQVRRQCLEDHAYQCQVCGCTSWRRTVDVHHLHYRNVGHERPEDVIPLCNEHHSLIHNQPDGYDMPVVIRLRRECEEPHWDDPLPAKVRERELRLSEGFSGFRVCRQCFAHIDIEDGADSSCPHCGSGVTPPNPSHVENQLSYRNADTLGFADAQKLHEAPSWEKAARFTRYEL